MIFTFNKCEHPNCLESGKVYHYPGEVVGAIPSSMVLCDEHTEENGFCHNCKQFKGFDAWFCNSGFCEDCIDEEF